MVEWIVRWSSGFAGHEFEPRRDLFLSNRFSYSTLDFNFHSQPKLDVRFTVVTSAVPVLRTDDPLAIYTGIFPDFFANFLQFSFIFRV